MSLNLLLETRDGFDYTGAEGWSEPGSANARIEPLVAEHAMVVGTT